MAVALAYLREYTLSLLDEQFGPSLSLFTLSSLISTKPMSPSLGDQIWMPV